MKLTRLGRMLVFLLVPWVLAALPAAAATVTNQASGSFGGVPLTPARPRAQLTRFGSAVTSALAEIVPNQVVASSHVGGFVYSILPTIGPGDSGVSRVDITPPAGYGNCS